LQIRGLNFAWLTTRVHVLPRERAVLKLFGYHVVLAQARISISLARGEGMAEEIDIAAWDTEEETVRVRSKSDMFKFREVY